jgi:signal transduction histidine kinase
VRSALLTAAVRRVEARWKQLYGASTEAGDIPRLLAAFALAADHRNPIYVAELEPRPALRRSQRLLEMLEDELLRRWRAGQVSAAQVLPEIAALREVRDSIENRYQQLPGAPLLGPDGLEFLVEVVHDLRSPLTSVLFLAETLQHGRSGEVNDLQRRQLGLIYSAALALSSVANNALGLAREGDQLEEGEPTPFSVTELMEGVHNIVRPMAEEKSLAMHLVPPRVDRRLGHPLELSRALLNLTTNALKFTETGAVVLGARDVEGNRVEFAVRDTGSGINPVAQATLFQPFRRTNGSRRYAFSSTGLGLAITHRLVEAMGGRLGYETDRGTGTRFYFELDLPPA